jgi:FkbM family methyltransferase
MSAHRWKEWLRRFMPRTMRPHRILAGPLRGFRIVTSWHDYPAAILGSTERNLLEWFERNVRPGETWLDVGAHYGYTALALCRLVGERGRVFAFEPMVATAGHLGRTRSLNGLTQLTIIPCGLGAPENLELRRLPTVRGMVDTTIDGCGSRAEAFLVARLESLWPVLAGAERRIDGVKVDVQGMEIETIRGMGTLLQEFHPKVVVEVHRGVDRSRLIELLESCGYSRTGCPIEPASNEIEVEYLDDRSYYWSSSRT